MKTPSSNLTTNDIVRLRDYGVKILGALPTQDRKFSKLDGNYEAAISRKTGIPVSTLGEMLDDLQKWGAITRPLKKPGITCFIIKKDVGLELERILLTEIDKGDDSLKQKLERVIFGPSTMEQTRRQILSILDKLNQKEIDDNIFANAIDQLIEARNTAIDNDDNSWVNIPDLREKLVDLVIGDTPRKRLPRCLRFLARLISESRCSYKWVDEKDLIKELGVLLKDEDQVSIDAIHVLKEIRSCKNEIPDSVVDRMIEGAWATIEKDRHNKEKTTPFVITNAAIEVLGQIIPYISTEQRIKLKQMLNEIKVDSNKQYHRKHTKGNKSPLNYERTFYLRENLMRL